MPQFATEYRILEIGVHLFAHGRYECTYIGNINTQFAVFCILPAVKEKAVTLTVSPPFSSWIVSFYPLTL